MVPNDGEYKKRRANEKFVNLKISFVFFKSIDCSSQHLAIITLLKHKAANNLGSTGFISTLENCIIKVL